MNRPVEEYVTHADTLAQDMLNTWGQFTMAGEGAALCEEFKEVFEMTCQFRTAKGVADNWRRAGIPTEAVDAEVTKRRLFFAKAYKVFHEKHES